MNVDKAARATRAFFTAGWNDIWDAKVWQVFTSSEHVAASKGFSSRDEAQAACDRMNLLAVLTCIREESDAMCAAGAQNHKAAWGPDAPIFEHSVYRAMIGALIAEVNAR